MVAARMSPMQTIVAATKTAAELLRLNRLGTIAAGKSADFVVLDGVGVITTSFDFDSRFRFS